MKYLLLLALIACNPHIYQQSAPPPGRSARLDSVDGFWGVKRYRLEISQGVALALTCEQGGPCEKTRVVSDNPAIAEVRPASLSALEAVGYGTPALVSHQSGVSEVLQNCLKVDYWDIDEMANQIAAVVQSDALRDVLLKNAQTEYKKLSWDDASHKVAQLYREHAVGAAS